MNKVIAIILALTMLVGCKELREEPRIVGSSTVFPFAMFVAEQFGRSPDFRTPIIEATGTGSGMKLFCSGIQLTSPDITNASRRMKATEFKLCQDNGVTDITEALIGYDGIVIANAKDGAEFDLTVTQLTIALASNGPKPIKWSDIDPSLPTIDIEVLGPPPSSGTRDAFEELVMHVGCKDTDLVECEGVGIRDDGPYVEAGENDNLIVSKLNANHDALGVFGYSFLEENGDKVKGAKINGNLPTFENIVSGKYPIARSLYFYIKKAHIGVIPGVAEYAAMFMSPNMIGDEGILIDSGLIPLTAELREKAMSAVINMDQMDSSTLK